MATYYGGYYTDVSQIKGPSGFYRIFINREPIVVYVDQSYDGGGWVLVLANRALTAGMNNLTYSDAVNSANYRSGGTNNGTNTTVDWTAGKLVSLADYNVWIGTKFWFSLAGRVTSNTVTVVQFVAGTNGTTLNNTGAHNKRYRWKFTSFNSTYAMGGVSAISDETSTGSPGFYNYHAASGFSLTTYNNDQDVYSSNCSTLYNNNPWWYGACWSGNYFAGGGYSDSPYWDGSAGDYYQYGAVYIK